MMQLKILKNHDKTESIIKSNIAETESAEFHNLWIATPILQLLSLFLET